jgi:hypothetical protein
MSLSGVAHSEPHRTHTQGEVEFAQDALQIDLHGPLDDLALQGRSRGKLGGQLGNGKSGQGAVIIVADSGRGFDTSLVGISALSNPAGVDSPYKLSQCSHRILSHWF